MDMAVQRWYRGMGEQGLMLGAPVCCAEVRDMIRSDVVACTQNYKRGDMIRGV